MMHRCDFLLEYPCYHGNHIMPCLVVLGVSRSNPVSINSPFTLETLNTLLLCMLAKIRHIRIPVLRTHLTLLLCQFTSYSQGISSNIK